MVFEGLKKKVAQARELKALEGAAYDQERKRLAPYSGKLKARAEERALRMRRKENAKKGKAGGGIFGTIMDVGGNIAKNSEQFYAPPSARDFMSPVTSGSGRKRKKSEDLFEGMY